MMQKCIGATLGSDEASVWNWENDRSVPQLRFLPKIIEFLGYDPRPNPTSLSKRLVFYREGKGWSQNQFAEVLRVDPTTLARWERGERLPRGDYLARITTLIDSGVEQ